MGKVKHARFDGRAHNNKKYQFPMGKVKSIKYIQLLARKQVSIPYGKGKDIINKEALYGYNRINSLWER